MTKEKNKGGRGDGREEDGRFATGHSGIYGAKQRGAISLEAIDAVVSRVRAGMFIRPAMAAIGRTKWSYHLWKRRGEAAAERIAEALDKGEEPDLGERPDLEELYAEFWLRIEEAEAELERERVDLLLSETVEKTEESGTDADGESFSKTRVTNKGVERRALMWWLERRWPERYGHLRTSGSQVSIEEFGKSVTVTFGPAPAPDEDGEEEAANFVENGDEGE